MGKVKGSVCWREDGSKEMWQEEGMRSDHGWVLYTYLVDKEVVNTRRVT